MKNKIKIAEITQTSDSILRQEKEMENWILCSVGLSLVQPVLAADANLPRMLAFQQHA